MTKPALSLIKSSDATAITKLFEKLTGRKPTAEEMREVERILQGGRDRD